MSDTTAISFRNDIVDITSNLSGMLLKIGCLDHYERLKAIAEDTLTLSYINELIQKPENLQEILGYFTCLKEYTNSVFKSRAESLYELDSVKGKLSVLLNEIHFKLESLSSLIRQVNGILSIA
jgi:hypothetical protein